MVHPVAALLSRENSSSVCSLPVRGERKENSGSKEFRIHKIPALLQALLQALLYLIWFCYWTHDLIAELPRRRSDGSKSTYAVERCCSKAMLLGRAAIARARGAMVRHCGTSLRVPKAPPGEVFHAQMMLPKYSLTNQKWFFLFFMCNLGAYSGASLPKFPLLRQTRRLLLDFRIRLEIRTRFDLRSTCTQSKMIKVLESESILRIP
eukprot:s1756_g14.t1